MKKYLVLTLLFLVSIEAWSQKNDWTIRVPSKEFVFIDTHWDYAKTVPADPNSDYGIHYGIEFGMRSYLPRVAGIEAKIAIESFPELYGGYFSRGGGFGVFWVNGSNEQFMYYTGLRLQQVFRTNPSTNIRGRKENIGWEFKTTYTFKETVYIGARLNWDTNNDVQLIDDNLPPSNRYTVNLVIGWNIGRIGGYRKNK